MKKLLSLIIFSAAVFFNGHLLSMDAKRYFCTQCEPNALDILTSFPQDNIRYLYTRDEFAMHCNERHQVLQTTFNKDIAIAAVLAEDLEKSVENTKKTKPKRTKRRLQWKNKPSSTGADEILLDSNATEHKETHYQCKACPEGSYYRRFGRLKIHFVEVHGGKNMGFTSAMMTCPKRIYKSKKTSK